MNSMWSNPWFWYMTQAAIENPAPLTPPPSHTKGVCPPYSGPSKRTLAKRKARAARS